MDIEELQVSLCKNMASRIIDEHLKTDDYKKLIESGESFHEQKTIIVLVIYDRVQRMLLDKRIKELAASSKETLLNELMSALKDIQSFESGLYTLTRLNDDSERLDSILNEYYGMVPNEKLHLFEAIEEIVETTVIEG